MDLPLSTELKQFYDFSLSRVSQAPGDSLEIADSQRPMIKLTQKPGSKRLVYVVDTGLEPRHPVRIYYARLFPT